MNELIEAAKAVIDKWDYYGNVHWEKIKTLRAAVERAESQEAVGFEEWWDRHADLKYKFVPIGQAKQLWTAAQQAERERIKEIVKNHASDGWVRCCTKILEKIDEVPS